MSVIYAAILSEYTNFPFQDPIYLAEQLAEYETEQQGMLTNNNADFLGWEKVPSDLRKNFSAAVQKDLEYFPSDWPELEASKFQLHGEW